jgi:hypothetical protein
MSEKSGSFLNALLTVGAFVGGAFLLGAAIEAMSKKGIFYTCPNCKFDELEHGTECCPNCNIALDWNQENAKSEVVS